MAMVVLPISARHSQARAMLRNVDSMGSRATLTRELLQKYPLISDQVDARELAVILTHLQRSLDTDKECAAVVEWGCYIGTTSLFIRRMLDAYAHPATFHVYDSFAGLPEKTDADISPAGEQFKAGELSIGKKAFEMQFKKAGLRTPLIHKAWFSDIVEQEVPEKIGFAYLDGDYYRSITDSLQRIWPKLTKRAIVVIDDYANEALPGAARAVDEWLQAHAGQLRVEASLGIITFD